MKIAIVDADLIGAKKHRFPNLACMKISAYHKACGDEVELVTNYDKIRQFDKVYISKIFTETIVPEAVLERNNVSYGGTGFFYDKAPALPEEIEHHFPDYHLYDEWVQAKMAEGKPRREFAYYLDYSIGFLTRGCFRRCSFCVNKNSSGVREHSPLSEFLDESRKKICLLDDNFLGCKNWRALLKELQKTKKPFRFRQGLDERILTEEKCEALFQSKYDGDYTFAFDDYKDAELIENKIGVVRKHTSAIIKFYCFTGYDRNDVWDEEFWKRDILELLMRIEILMRHRCLPYVMRYLRYKDSPYRGMYISIARWCNQPSLFKKKSLRDFAELNGRDSACYRYLSEFEKKYPEVTYFYDLKFEDIT